jgi:hypothetical protein
MHTLARYGSLREAEEERNFFFVVVVLEGREHTNVAFSGFSGLLGEVVCNKTLLNKEKCYVTNINSMTASSAYTMVN